MSQFPFRVMTFNVRSVSARDGVNAWKNRAALNVRVIRAQAPDLIGFQEVQEAHLDVYRRELTDYCFHLGPDATCAIFWSAARFALEEAGGFYLSTTPHRRSTSWNASCARVATWVRLRPEDSGAALLHVNTHLDHVSRKARIEGTNLILRRLDADGGGAPVVLTGDFNAPDDTPPYDLLEAAGFVDTYADRPEVHTFHRFQGATFVPVVPVMLRLDRILTRDGDRSLRNEGCAIVTDADPPLYPSDHYPVVADLVLDAARSANPAS
ncbi:MAG TPA: endonuclease/exonuclease/phosphatase family protein [Candidatus Binatia bacterium]|nr:endonuclease/exonuclease/phosphatase family protein [Candidatus Binatia bacterium]